jgi:hypothetical protein
MIIRALTFRTTTFTSPSDLTGAGAGAADGFKSFRAMAPEGASRPDERACAPLGSLHPHE